MNITITFRHMDATEALKNHVHDKLNKIETFLHKPVEVQVHLAIERYLHCVEVHIQAKNFTGHSIEKSEDMYNSIDRAVEKVMHSVKKHKEKTKDNKPHNAETQ